MMKTLIAAILLLWSGVAWGQLPPGPGGLVVGGAITGTCPNGYLLYSNNSTLGCEAAGSASFSSLTSGTNTTATMTVGSGGTLTYSGSGVVNASTVQGDANVALTDAANIFTKAQAVTPTTISSSTCTGTYTLTPSGTASNDYVLTCAASTAITIANPSTVTPGQSISFSITQPSSGSAAILSALGTDYLVPGGTLPTLTTTNGATDLIVCREYTTSKIICGSAILNVSNP